MNLDEYADRATTDAPPVCEGVVTGQPIVTRGYSHDEQPRADLETVSPGDTIEVFDTPIRVKSVTRWVERGEKHLRRFGLAVDPIGTVSTLYVDWDPYLLSVCNGPVYEIPTDRVVV